MLKQNLEKFQIRDNIQHFFLELLVFGFLKTSQEQSKNLMLLNR